MGVAHADTAETKGGIKIKTDDGRFEANVNGRIQWDAYMFDDDLAETTGGTEFRRSRLTLSGKLYGWEYKFENDFAAQGSSSGSGFRDMYIATKLGPGKLTLGQFKPYRSMEELTSSNEITVAERPFSSATGIYSGRQFQQGVGYLIAGNNYTAGVSAFTMNAGGVARNEGAGAAARATFAPIVSDTRTVHLGISVSQENLNRSTPSASAEANYAGRRGPKETIAVADTAAGGEVQVIGLEAATVLGPFYAQAEYAMASFDISESEEQDVNTYYLQATYNVTGESKPYKKGNGVFGSVKPKNSFGAIELLARYDYIENKDVDNLEVSETTVGANWYVNPNVRFMLGYNMGDNQLTDDKTKQVVLRTQLVF